MPTIANTTESKDDNGTDSAYIATLYPPKSISIEYNEYL